MALSIYVVPLSSHTQAMLLYVSQCLSTPLPLHAMRPRPHPLLRTIHTPPEHPRPRLEAPGSALSRHRYSTRSPLRPPTHYLTVAMCAPDRRCPAAPASRLSSLTQLLSLLFKTDHAQFDRPCVPFFSWPWPRWRPQ